MNALHNRLRNVSKRIANKRDLAQFAAVFIRHTPDHLGMARCMWSLFQMSDEDVYEIVCKLTDDLDGIRAERRKRASVQGSNTQNACGKNSASG